MTLPRSLPALQSALQKAGAQDDASRIAALLLEYAGPTAPDRRVSPLDAARRGNLEQAWRLADEWEGERDQHEHLSRRDWWYLLIAGELKDRNQWKEAQATLARLADRIPTCQDWLRFFHLPYFLAPLYETDSVRCWAPQHLLWLDDRWYPDLCRELARRGRFAAAVESAVQAMDLSWRAEALRVIVEMQTGVERMPAEQRAAVIDNTLAAMSRAAQEIQTANARATALVKIAEVRSIAGLPGASAEFAAALEAARRIEEDEERATALAEVAVASARAGERATARDIFVAAGETLQSVPDEQKRTGALEKLVDMAAWVGEEAALLRTARQIARQIEAAAPKIKDDLAWGWSLVRVAQELIRIGDQETARGTLARMVPRITSIESHQSRAETLTAIAHEQNRAAAGGAAIPTLALARSAADQIEDGEERRGAQKEIAVELARAGALDAALQTAAQIDDRSCREEALEGIVTAQAQLGAHATALRIAAQIGERKKRESAIGAVAKAQAKAGLFAEALATVQTIAAAGEGESRTRESAVRAIATAQAEAGLCAEALATAETIAAVDERAWTLKAIGGVLEGKGDAANAAAVTTLALRAAQEIESPSSRSSCLRELAQRKGQTPAAARSNLLLAREAAQQIPYLEERARELEWIARAQVEQGDDEAARDTLALALQAGAGKRDGELLREIVELQLQMGAFVTALETAMRIADTEDRGYALGELSSRGAATAEEAAAALALVRQRADHADHSLLLQLIATAAARTGAIAIARQVVREIAAPAGRAQALASIAEAEARAGNQEEAREICSAALEIARSIADPETRAGALRPIAAAQARAGAGEAACDTFAAALDAVRGLPDPDPPFSSPAEWITQTQVEIAREQARSRAFTEALRTARGIEPAGERAGVLASIAQMQARAGRQDEAWATCEIALKTAQSIEGPGSRISPLQDIASAQAEAGRPDAARATFATALRLTGEEARTTREKGALFQLSTGSGLGGMFIFTWLYHLRSLAATHAWAGEIDAAFEIVRQIEDEAHRSQILEAITAAQVQAGELDAARRTAEQIADKGDYVRGLTAIAVAQAQAGTRDDARQTFAAAVQNARSLPTERIQASTLGAIAIAQAQSGLGEEALRTAAAIAQDRHQHLLSIAAALAAAGDREAFKQILIPLLPYTTSLLDVYQLGALLVQLYPEQKRLVVTRLA